ncbi:MAG: helix-turn-helix transcriptional regulator [Eubacteriales bacterium]|nr:helix-turn-helix transcriptional regulator [Eubacteriales bacterium]
MRQILAYSIHISTPVSFSRAGKFESLDENWTHPASRLEDFELIIVTRNKLYIKYQDEKYTVGEGEYLLLAPPLKNTGNTKMDKIRKGFQKSNCSFYWMHFNCRDVSPRSSLSQDYINDGRDNILIPVHNKLAVPEKALLLMVRLQDSILSGYENCYTDLLSTLILCEIANQHRISYQNESSGNNNGPRQLFNDISGYISHEMHKPLKISDIARQFNYNEKYLSKLFKRFSGMTLKQYITDQKMTKADFLLVNSTIPVSEISARLGFASYHSFERAYVNCRSMTPTEYRQLFAGKITNYS